HLAQAAPLYRLALPLWRPEDVERGRRALLDQVRQDLEDRPLEALEALASLAPDPEVLLLRSRTFIRLGRFREALELLEELADTPERSALRGIALYRMGRVEEAKNELPKAKAGGPHAQGEAHNLEGLFLLGQGAFREAAEAFSQAAVRFLLAGEEARHLNALNNRAVALAELGEGEKAFFELLALVEGRPLLEARVRLNLGVVRERAGRVEEAEGLYRDSLELARLAGNLEAMGRAWNNLGALYHRTGRLQEAQKAYGEALKLAREARDLVLLAAVLANRAELSGERAFLEEAVRVLEESGQESLARRYRDRLETL
ncbi:transcriptional regulator, partial [Thermus scotoductus]|uniref:tetratricopeptide repeat protein n=1 Tax=Thermus scotoductus TaxID=37636 RepID=UPI001004B2B4